MMYRNPAALRCGVLVELHVHDLGKVPFVLDDEGLFSSAEDIREKLSVIVEVREGKSSGLHGCLRFGSRCYFPHSDARDPRL